MGSPRQERLRSLDALRGFDMFWIVGGSGFVAALAEATDWRLLRWIESQCHHVEWHGFRFWDLIFPLFLFLAGVSMPFSLAKRRASGANPVGLHLHVVRRGLLLVLLGVVYNGLFAFDFENLRYASVLGRIGLAWMLAGLIVLHTGPRGQVIWGVGLLLGYWAALAWIPVPGYGAGDLSPGATLTDWVDRLLLPGRLHRGVRDPEGILGTLPAVVTALMGVQAGHALRRGGGFAKAVVLAGAGLVCLGVGWLWDFAFPINKNLWSSSFVMWTGGWSLLALAVFHLVIDVWGFQRWAFFFVVIGTNPITIYVLQGFVDFDGLAGIVFANAEGGLHPALLAGTGLLLRWLVLYAMYRARWFLRV
ncbi:MAG: DUF5009 domain-containing protein [Planctomycetota bacterium]|nr:DUF5009 domain-containing protein [Planctomycetota bacterium]